MTLSCEYITVLCFFIRRQQHRMSRPRLPIKDLHCLSRRALSSSSSTRNTSSSSTPSSGYAKLTHRRLLCLHGADATQFLQGLVTANVRPHLTSGFYAAFLNAQGRLLNDVFIYPATHSSIYTSQLPPGKDASAPAYFIEVDAQQAPILLKHLKRHKLRAKFDIRPVDEGEWNAWSAWDDAEPWTPHPSNEPIPPSTTTATTNSTNDIGCVDARAPGMGRRLLLPGSSSRPPKPSHAEVPLPSYHLRRILRGVPEGPLELPPASALPLESNMDFMGGVDFRKGCYVGQELTIRTHHTGVVRKRVLPVQLYTAASAPPEKLAFAAEEMLAGRLGGGANVLPAGGRRGRPAGRWLGGVGNVGLALVRLEMMTDLVLTAGETSRWSAEDEFKVSLTTAEGEGQGQGEGETEAAAKVVGEGEAGEEVRIKAFVPEWHRSKTKVKVANRQVV